MTRTGNWRSGCLVDGLFSVNKACHLFTRRDKKACQAGDGLLPSVAVAPQICFCPLDSKSLQTFHHNFNSVSPGSLSSPKQPCVHLLLSIAHRCISTTYQKTNEPFLLSALLMISVPARASTPHAHPTVFFTMHH